MTEQSYYDPSVSPKMRRYLELLLTENEKVNLTAITDPEEALVKHLQDSLAIGLWAKWSDMRSGMDLGTGGGLPGIPLAIAYPDKRFVLLEASQKKVRFLQNAVSELQLENVEIVNGRAEETGREAARRESLDFVLSRAVASLNILMELSFPFLRIGGHLVAYKGPGVVDEIGMIDNAKDKLHAGDPTVINYQLPSQYGDRALAIIQKIQSTPDIYPRRPGIPEKRPL